MNPRGGTTVPLGMRYLFVAGSSFSQTRKIGQQERGIVQLDEIGQRRIAVGKISLISTFSNGRRHGIRRSRRPPFIALAAGGIVLT